MTQKLSHEAIAWWVLNESDQADDEARSQSWEKWCTEPAHRMDYVLTMRLALELRELPPPALASRRELLKDVQTREAPAH